MKTALAHNMSRAATITTFEVLYIYILYTVLRQENIGINNITEDYFLKQTPHLF